ncbi:hypothetical protein MHU86_1675 [Fragilaria crotonensis]|nr:hypothetical protein MHU86_1675 [Fragilaria crotonensis]
MFRLSRVRLLRYIPGIRVAVELRWRLRRYGCCLNRGSGDGSAAAAVAAAVPSGDPGFRLVEDPSTNATVFGAAIPFPPLQPPPWRCRAGGCVRRLRFGVAPLRGDPLRWEKLLHLLPQQSRHAVRRRSIVARWLLPVHGAWTWGALSSCVRVEDVGWVSASCGAEEGGLPGGPDPE